MIPRPLGRGGVIRNAPVLLVLINALLQVNQKKAGVIKLVDSTPLPVCKNELQDIKP
jgi:hypothetical protein